ncbi:hypothetical protein N7495_003061 [Penicillium taxi]|uniref:uncharacterized protein n=1 Tax=Penicillium taxi TaxID=168475 RepID=UPI00254565FC|nr:uncharacterized protein N7495_003061 [Penicillium taxi]KAJ5902533.1 hypothetical protein N7495_003061 [Penicillium taxi]
MFRLPEIFDPILEMAGFIAALANPFNYVGGITFKPDKDIKDLSGKVVLVTGGNAGLGKETILQLAKHNPSKIFMGARLELKAAEAIQSIKSSLQSDVEMTWLSLHLTLTESIQNATKQFKAQSQRLDILILNAGVMALPPGKQSWGTKSNLEQTTPDTSSSRNSYYQVCSKQLRGQTQMLES